MLRETLQVSNGITREAFKLDVFVCLFIYWWGESTWVINLDFVVQNLTDTCNTSRERDLCPSKKVIQLFAFSNMEKVLI